MALSKILPASQDQYVGARNFIINGSVQVWQRGISQTGTGYGCADRWKNTVSGTTTFSQDTASLPTGFEYALRWTTGASSSYGQSRQFIETSTIKILRGRTLTASAYVKVSGTYSGAVTWEIAYSTTSDVDLGNTWVQLTETNVVTASASDASSDYKRISCNVTIPSNALGAYIGIVPSAAQASGEWVSVTGVQLEVGSTATDFEHPRSYGDELFSCQRYYQRTQSFMGAGHSVSGVVGISHLHRAMRANPTISQDGVFVITDGYSIDATQSSTGASITSNNINTTGYYLYIQNISGLTAGKPYMSRLSNANGLLYDAEL